MAFPLGGIGTGHFCICGDGGFRQWQIINQVNHVAYLPGTFLAIRTRSKRGKPEVRVLQSSALYDEEGFEPAPLVSDHIVPCGARNLMEKLPGIKHISFLGQYPMARIEYGDDLPVRVSLSAFSPFIPLNQKDSALPIAFLIFTLQNQSDKPLEVSLMASLQNAVGWDGLTPISDVTNSLYGGNRNILIRRSGANILLMDNPLLEDGSFRKGEMALAVLSDRVSARPQWDDLESIWGDFKTDGKLVPDQPGSSPAGKTWNGALCASLDMKPGESREVVFAIAWHFPNRYVNWDQRGLGVSDEKTKFWLGNMYGNWFSGVLDVIAYGQENLVRLREETEAFTKCFFGTTLPVPVLDAVSSQISTIRSPTCLWVEDERFHGFEGCCGSSTGSFCSTGGCCPLDCTHVWNYEQTLSRLFPELERKMREVDLEFNMGDDGRIPHRTPLPLYLPRWRDDDPTSHVYAADGHCGTILKTYREYRACGEKAFLDRCWPALKKSFEFAIHNWDADLDGVFDGPQWNTYDCHLYGHNSFVSGLYLASLRAMEEMSKIQGDMDLAKECRGLFEKGRSRMESELWNGEYYVQRYDAEKYKTMQYGTGCHSDQLLGQWWAHILDLGYILPTEHVRKALLSIYSYNFRDNLREHVQKPRAYLKREESGLLICTWPRGGRPGSVTLYSDEVWTGIEYAVAGLMFFEGMIDEGLAITETARKRHDGRLRNPWNEVECGDHYVRPMSSWTMMEALSGYVYDGGSGAIRFWPKCNKEDFRCFFTSAKGWGRYSQTLKGSTQVCELRIENGSLELGTIEMPQLLENPKRFSVFLGGKKVSGVDISSDGDMIVTRGKFNICKERVLRVVAEG